MARLSSELVQVGLLYSAQSKWTGDWRILHTYLDLSFCDIEWQTANNDFTVLGRSSCSSGSWFDSWSGWLHSLLYASDWSGLDWLVATRSVGTLRLLLAINDRVK